MYNLNKCDFSIVLPAYNEASNLALISRALSEVMVKIGITNYEIIIVDDGSNDDTPALIQRLSEGDSRIKGVILSRNFGHQAAVNAGIDYTCGAVVAILDSDFQHPPEALIEFFNKYKQGADIVFGVRNKTKGISYGKEFLSRNFYAIFNKMSDFKLAANIADFGLFSRRVINTLKRLPEKDRFLRGLVQWVGFKKDFVYYDANERLNGERKYTLKKSLKLAASAITSFSPAPLRISLWVGLLSTVSGLAYLCYILYRVIFYPSTITPGWTSIIVVVLIMGGAQLIILGIIGEYLYKIFNEIKGRPLYVINHKIGFGDYKLNSAYGIDNESE